MIIIIQVAKYILQLIPLDDEQYRPQDDIVVCDITTEEIERLNVIIYNQIIHVEIVNLRVDTSIAIVNVNTN